MYIYIYINFSDNLLYFLLYISEYADSTVYQINIWQLQLSDIFCYIVCLYVVWHKYYLCPWPLSERQDPLMRTQRNEDNCL